MCFLSLLSVHLVQCLIQPHQLVCRSSLAVKKMFSILKYGCKDWIFRICKPSLLSGLFIIHKDGKFGKTPSVNLNVYSVQFTVYSFQCTAYSLQFTAYRLLFTVYSVQLTVYSLQRTAYSLQLILYSVQWKM